MKNGIYSDPNEFMKIDEYKRSRSFFDLRFNGVMSL